MAPRAKRESNEVDTLVAKVDKLHAEGMSVNKACAKVGLQNTVYYFRKRRDASLAATSEITKDLNAPVSFGGDLSSLTKEYKELEARLNALKMKIAEKVMSKAN